jgi:hypothetical protein
MSTGRVGEAKDAYLGETAHANGVSVNGGFSGGIQTTAGSRVIFSWPPPRMCGMGLGSELVKRGISTRRIHELPRLRIEGSYEIEGCPIPCVSFIVHHGAFVLPNFKSLKLVYFLLMIFC